MNGAHFHLLVNHFPIVGVIIGFLVLLAGTFLKKQQIMATALGIFAFSALAAIASYSSGEGAEEVVEDIPGISEKLIHVHQNYAGYFFAFMLILGVSSLITLYMQIKQSKFIRYAYLLIFVLAIACGIMSAYVGTSGGEIRHSEIRSDADAPSSNKAD